MRIFFMIYSFTPSFGIVEKVASSIGEGRD
jgi:hypothetical protein